MNVHQSSSAPRPLMSERRVSLLGAMLVAVGPISLALFTPAMPELVRVFGTTESAIKLTLSVYFAGFAFAQLVCGPLSDGYGRKPVTLVFMTIYLVASLLALMAPTVETLIAARFLQGVGAAVGIAISRAIVRDLFTSERSARIMNLMGMILGLGPAFAPTIGGVTMDLFGWEAIFVLMLVLGVIILLLAHLLLVETVVRDPSRIRPRALVRSYGTLLGSGYFMSSSIVMLGAIGALYTQATVLPFILMDRVGLTPTQFGIGMLMQSGMFFMGGLTVRQLMKRRSATQLVPVGLTFIGIGSVLVFFTMNFLAPTFIGVMGPVAVYAYGIAFVMPAMSTASLAPFPYIAGAAAALGGFMQMVGGLVGGVLASLFGNPMQAMGVLIPAMGLTAILGFLWWRRLPEPAMAREIVSRGSDLPAPPAE